MWGRKVDDRQPPALYQARESADFDRGSRWLGERYEYLFLAGLPLGDTNQRDLSAAGQHGWKVIQIGVDVSALGHAVSAWAMLERTLGPVQQEHEAHRFNVSGSRIQYADGTFRDLGPDTVMISRPFMDEHGNPRLRER
jgi:hypothetical protein